MSHPWLLQEQDTIFGAAILTHWSISHQELAS